MARSRSRRRSRISAVAVFSLTGTLAAGLAAGTFVTAAAAVPVSDPRLPANPTVNAAAGIGGGQPALGEAWKPPQLQGAAKLAGTVVPGQVILKLAAQTKVTDSRVKTAGQAPTSSAPLNDALAKLHATALRPLSGDLVVASFDPKQNKDTVGTAAQLSVIDGVVSAEPNRYVTGMSSGSTPIPQPIIDAAKADALKKAANKAAKKPPPPPLAALPDNYGLTSSLQSWLNAGSVNAMGAYSDLTSRYGQLPGQGEIITNVSVGDLTDQAMADAGDGYVKANGPTTVIQGGQRYLDIPSMPLIPAYTADPSGTLNPLGSTENQDAVDGEILLDFSVMAPLPHDKQRPENTGSGFTDLLGLAPGASYRLVVPTQPTMDQIATALLAAAKQEPRPNVINASLGFGTDTTGFAGRYLEDDPALQSTIATIVQQYGITVSISANDGTRLYTPTAVGPDGGSTPTDLTRDPAKATNVNDDAASTTPSKILDSGAIAAGGTTLDDTLAGGVQAPAVVAETRISGAGDFSSGFGTRIDLSAPSDNIVALSHAGSTAQSVSVDLSGGTSASAPEIAAAAAVIDQTGKLTGRPLTPAQIRDLLVKTANKVPTSAQIDRQLQVGPQLDLTAAVESLLPKLPGKKTPQIARFSVAHRVTVSQLGGAFVEYTDPAHIDLAGPADSRGTLTGQGLAGPVTIAADVVNASKNAKYTLTIGSTTFPSSAPSIRLLPAQILAAAGLNAVSTTPQTVKATFTVRDTDGATASVDQQLTFSASDGTITEAQAPTVAPVVAEGQDVTVHYDISAARYVEKPTLVLSTVGHWNPALAPLFNPAWSLPLTAKSGDVTIPASAFKGGGLYGVGVIQNNANPARPLYGEFAPFRVGTATADQRPAAPTLAAVGQQLGHQANVTRANPGFSLHYSVDGLGAKGAMLEISAPAPTLFNSLNTFTNQNGTVRDADGVTSGSVVYQALPGKSGTVKLDALKLGLGSSVQYNLRVVAVDAGGKTVGQASPSSALVVDDGLVPGGGTVSDFVAAGADSVAAVGNVAGSPGSSLRHYDPATGAYGLVIANDPNPAAEYDVLGIDTSAHTVLVAHWTDGGDAKSVEVWNLATNTEIGAPTVLPESRYLLLGGRVDPARHRAALLVWAQPGFTDQILPFDLATATPGPAIPLDPAVHQTGRYFVGMDIDPSTGVVQVAHLGESLFCFGGGSGQVANVDLGAKTVTPSGFSSKCGAKFVSAQDGSAGLLLSYSTVSVNFPGKSAVQTVDEKTLAAAATYALRQESPLAVAVDSAHHIGIVGYGTPVGTVVLGQPFAKTTDSNATSQLDVVDLTTGKVLKTLSAFNFTSGFGGPLNAATDPTIQLDPTTRTGYTYGPYGVEIEAFSY